MGKGVVTYKADFGDYVFVTKQGGFSDEVWNSNRLQSYLKGCPGGYIGSSDRKGKAWADKMVEKALRETGLKAEGIGCWLTSTAGRHLADHIDKDKKAFESVVKSYTKGAFQDVAAWEHPDHNGTLKSTIELKKLLTSQAS
jgi:hypothetical protein